MTVKQMHYFLTVAETKNFTKSAQKHFIAQTAMSQQISAIEKELGFRLFDRTNKSVTLTAAGQLLYTKLKPLVVRFEDAVRLAAAAAGIENYAFRIGLSSEIPNRFLVGALRALAAAEPDVTPQLHLDQHAALVETVAGGNMDVAMVRKSVYQPRAMLSTTELFSYEVLEYVLAVPQGHPLSGKQDLVWQDLSGLRLIAFATEENDTTGFGLRQLLKSHKVSAEIFTLARNTESALLYVEAGLGCCLLPAHYARNSYNSYCMIPLQSMTRDTLLMICHKNHENPLIPEFINICRKELSELMSDKDSPALLIRRIEQENSEPLS